jgi:hypothetical protein
MEDPAVVERAETLKAAANQLFKGGQPVTYVHRCETHPLDLTHPVATPQPQTNTFKQQ